MGAGAEENLRGIEVVVPEVIVLSNVDEEVAAGPKYM